MINWNQLVGIIAFLIWAVFTALIYRREHKDEEKNIVTVKSIARIGVFGAISTLLYVIPIFNIPIPAIFPTFLKFHFDEIPALIAGFAFGPYSALGIILIKTLIKIPLGGATTMYVGEISDFIYSCALILPATFIYRKHRKFKFALLGLSIGFVSQIVVALFFNIYIMVPTYMRLFSMDENAILSMMPPFIKNPRWSYGLISVLPFNVIKNFIVIAITLVIYKPLRRLIEKIKA